MESSKNNRCCCIKNRVSPCWQCHTRRHSLAASRHNRLAAAWPLSSPEPSDALSDGAKTSTVADFVCVLDFFSWTEELFFFPTRLASSHEASFLLVRCSCFVAPSAEGEKVVATRMEVVDDGTALTALAALTAGRVDASTRRVLAPSSTVELKRRLGRENKSPP